jgi:hypothetical protein
MIAGSRTNTSVPADEMEVAPARTLPIGGVRIVWVDVGSSDDVG